MSVTENRPSEWKAALVDRCALVIEPARAAGVITDAEATVLLDAEKVSANPEAAEQAIAAITRRTQDARFYPIAARGLLRRGANGLVFPSGSVTTEQAREILEQIEATAELRELTPREARARRRLRQAPGIRQPLSEKEETTLQRAELKRRSKAAKRARASQAMMASARGQVVAGALRELAAAGGDA